MMLLVYYIALWPLATHITVFFHELGHSMVALLFSKGPVEMYVGSYGDKAQSHKIVFGRLSVFLEKRSFLWNKGLCVPTNTPAREWQEFLFVLAGPGLSLLFGLLVWVMYYYQGNADSLLWKVLAPVFIFSAGFDFLRNLIPSDKPIYTETQSVAYNDGYQLREIFFRRGKRRDFKRAAALLIDKQYAEAGRLFEHLARDNFRRASTYSCAIAAYWQAKDTGKALELAEASFDDRLHPLFSQIQLGVLYSLAGRHEEALRIYTGILEEKPDDAEALNNIGFTRIVQQRYDEALAIFEKILVANPSDAYALSQTGFIHYRKNGAPNGLPDLQKAAEINPDNAYVLRNLAIYHFEQKNLGEAKTLFQRALELDPTTFEVAEYLGLPVWE